MTKQALLDQIKADIVKNNICPNLAKTATQLVFGDGSIDADLFFIGEAPGKKEDEQGVPFVGASGKFLDKMLESIHLTRSQVYITNIVKYRPPENRDPSRDEKVAFMPYLTRQIEVIKPKVIITLGRHSGMQFLLDLKIGEDHGKPKRISILLNGKDNVVSGEEPKDIALQLTTQPLQLKVTVLPLYHPAAALYNGSQRQKLIDDFAQIPDILLALSKIPAGPNSARMRSESVSSSAVSMDTPFSDNTPISSSVAESGTDEVSHMPSLKKFNSN